MIYTDFSQLYAAQSTVVIQNAGTGVPIDEYAKAFGESEIMHILMDEEKPLTDYIAVIKKAIAANRVRALAALIQIVGQTQKKLNKNIVGSKPTSKNEKTPSVSTEVPKVTADTTVPVVSGPSETSSKQQFSYRPQSYQLPKK